MSKFRIALFCLIAAHGTLAASKTEVQLEDPWKGFSKISQGNYLDPLSSLKAQEKAYLESELRDSYLQAVATFFSFVGRYDEAQKYFDIMSSSGNQLPVPEDLSWLKSEDAISAVSSAGKDHQVVMMNEAHHVPETRALTFALLKPLYDSGFRYLAAETFDSNELAKSEAKGFPLRHIGFYTAEPHFSEIAREAMRIGFHLIAYEYMELCDYKKDPVGCQDKRERGEAHNLIDRILKSDPSAKILVHAGYGHIDKVGGTSTFPWVPMARYFKEFSGIDPFSVDQVEFRSRGNLLSESKHYRRLVKFFKVKQPSVLRSSKGLWTALPNHFDVQVILPDSSHDNSYPMWGSRLYQRKEVKTEWTHCSTFPCLVQAVLEGEEKDAYIPFDQIFAESKSQANTKLMLRSGTYFIYYKSQHGTVKHKVRVE